ncbi:hypothetical protein IQ07DRAFT_223225 [Pyrenochaeta sp. DS3sAY3a]|nr:hypothetical protein IQ07DRAFT_223225 [Pyrenochaeta sp. DS3sAY3a]
MNPFYSTDEYFLSYEQIDQRVRFFLLHCSFSPAIRLLTSSRSIQSHHVPCRFSSQIPWTDDFSSARNMNRYLHSLPSSMMRIKDVADHHTCLALQPLTVREKKASWSVARLTPRRWGYPIAARVTFKSTDALITSLDNNIPGSTTSSNERFAHVFRHSISTSRDASVPSRLSPLLHREAEIRSKLYSV